jgi:hypothetical protein
MSEFDKLKDEGEQYAKDHPQQVKEAEDTAEKKIGIGQQGAQPDDGQHGTQDKADDGS